MALSSEPCQFPHGLDQAAVMVQVFFTGEQEDTGHYGDSEIYGGPT